MYKNASRRGYQLHHERHPKNGGNHEAYPASWKQAQGLMLHKKGDRETLTNYRLLSISPTLIEVFWRNLQSAIAAHPGVPLRPGTTWIQEGHSTVSLLHLVETIIHNSMTTKKGVNIVHIDIAESLRQGGQKSAR